MRIQDGEVDRVQQSAGEPRARPLQDVRDGGRASIGRHKEVLPLSRHPYHGCLRYERSSRRSHS